MQTLTNMNKFFIIFLLQKLTVLRIENYNFPLFIYCISYMLMF